LSVSSFSINLTAQSHQNSLLVDCRKARDVESRPTKCPTRTASTDIDKILHKIDGGLCTCGTLVTRNYLILRSKRLLLTWP